MTTWTSKQEVKQALQFARQVLKNARQIHGKNSPEAAEALKKCNEIQTVLDRWDSLHS